MEHYNGLYGNYLTMTFNEVFPEYEVFKTDYDQSGLLTDLTEPLLITLYNLLNAEFRNSHIANSDVYQFKAKMFSTIWQYGDTWAKKVEYQKEIRGLDIDELQKGSKNIYNHSYNPSTAPSTDTLDELPTIDDQNTTNFKKSKLDAYFQATQYLDANFTQEFLSKFRKLFIKITEPNDPLIYEVDY